MNPAEWTAPSAAIRDAGTCRPGDDSGQLRAPFGAVVIRVEEFPDEETVEEMELDSPFDLLGLYHR